MLQRHVLIVCYELINAAQCGSLLLSAAPRRLLRRHRSFSLRFHRNSQVNLFTWIPVRRSGIGGRSERTSRKRKCVWLFRNEPTCKTQWNFSNEGTLKKARTHQFEYFIALHLNNALASNNTAILSRVRAVRMKNHNKKKKATSFEYQNKSLYVLPAVWSRRSRPSFHSYRFPPWWSGRRAGEPLH